MNYITETVSLGFLDTLTSNIYMLTALFIGLMIMSAVVNGKRGLYYTSNKKDEKMKTHGLNTIYHLNEKKRLDYEDINMMIAYCNIAAALVAAVAIIVAHLAGLDDTWSFVVGLIALVGATYLIVVRYGYKKIADKYPK